MNLRVIIFGSRTKTHQNEIFQSGIVRNISEQFQIVHRIHQHALRSVKLREKPPAHNRTALSH